jgi:hypothetical protein
VVSITGHRSVILASRVRGAVNASHRFRGD